VVAFYESRQFRRPSQMKDIWYVPGLLLLGLMVLASLFVSLRMGDHHISPQTLDRLRAWKNVIGDGMLLPVFMILLGRYRLGQKIDLREEELYESEQGLLRKTYGLEQSVKERTAELSAEIEERHRADLLNRSRNQVLEMLAKNEPLDPTLKVLLATITGQRSVWGSALHQVEREILRLRASVGVPEMLMEHLQQIDAAFLDAPEAAALRRGGIYTIENTLQERTPWRQLLSANGISSVWSIPFFAPEGNIIGIVTVYSRLRANPGERDLALLEMVCSMATLVFEHQRLHQQLLLFAYHDVLTGVPNRRLGEERLEVAIARSKAQEDQVAVLWIDLDRFKYINDTHGHPIGDLVLQQIASRLSGRLRGGDTVARMGGDEFMIILSGVQSRESAEQTASELHRIVTAPLSIGGVDLKITVSIGISLYPADGQTAEQLKQNADNAMYQAKFEHVRTRSFTPVLGMEASALRELKEELTSALQNGGYEIDYQPQCTVDGTIVKFEALLRFRHPRLGTIPPARFVPIAEEMGLIVPLGEWVLRNICQQSVEWQRQGLDPMPIAVNISALQFARRDFAEGVGAILIETGLNPKLLELEVTESVVMKDHVESSRQLEYLSNLGIRIAIDDFGTGYSSLSYLHQLPIDVLKIDRSFVEKITEVEGTRPIVDAVISMAHTLGLSVVAEGVETLEQLLLLEQSHCDTMQGYFFSPALRAEEAAACLVNRRCEEYGDACDLKGMAS